MSGDFRLAIPAAAAWAGSAVLIGVPGFAVTALTIAWGSAAVAIVVAFGRRSFAVVALALAAVALCCTSVAIGSGHRQPADLLSAAGENRPVTVSATTTETVRPGARSWSVLVDGRLPIRVFGEAPSDRLDLGSTVELTGTLSLTDPGDETAFLLFPDAPPEVTAPPPWYLDWANHLRSSFAAAADDLPGDGGDLLPGLAIGDTGAVTSALDASMKAASLTHLTAVSGANCAVVIGLVMGAGAALGFSRRMRIVASLVILVGFVILVTPEPSVLRAAVMAALVLAALSTGRPVRGLPVLSLACLVLLVGDPWLARSYGFVLSVLATAGLLLLSGPLAARLAGWMPRWLALVIAVPLAAQLACQPVIVLLNAALPTYGVVANVLAAPAAPLATVVGLAACVLLPLAPPLGYLLCQLAWLPSTWIASVARFCAHLPAAQLPWPEGWIGVVLLAVLSVLLVLALSRRWALAVLLIVVAGYGGVVGGTRVAEQVGRPDWQVAMCDVGQGDASVVRSEGMIALIDTGPDPAPLTDCLADLGIDHLDLLVLTHYDLDHVGGVGAVIGRVDRVLVGPDDGREARIVEDLLAGGAAVEQVARGASGVLGSLRWQVVWPTVQHPGLDPGNDLSVTLLVTPLEQPGLSAIFLGDLGERAQDRLLSVAPLGAVDVVKVSHHGSADQSAAMYRRLSAIVGIIGVGAGNDYGHPTESLLSLLAGVATAAVRTDEHGLILLAPGTSPGTVVVWTQR